MKIEEIIKRLTDIKICCERELKSMPNYTPFSLQLDIKALDNAIQLLEQQRWIPISERSPEDETFVLTTIKLPNRIARARSGWYNDGFFYNDNGDTWKATDREVIAWKSSPEPYK